MGRPLSKFLLAVMLAALFLLPGCGGGGSGKSHDQKVHGFTKHYADSQFQITENKLYSVELVTDGKPLTLGRNSVDIIIHDARDIDVGGAAISVLPWMPEEGKGAREATRVVERRGGRYTVENIYLQQAGVWELRITIQKGETKDGALFVFPVSGP